MKNRRNLRFYSLLVAIIYASASNIIPFLHVFGIIMPHNHNECAACNEHKSHNIPLLQFFKSANNRKSDSGNKDHDKTCAICSFVKYFAGVKYFTTQATFFAEKHFSKILSLNSDIFPQKFLLPINPRAPPLC